MDGVANTPHLTQKRIEQISSYLQSMEPKLVPVLRKYKGFSQM